MFIVHIVDSRRISGENGGDMRNKSTSSVGIPHKRTLNPPWKLQLVTQIINDGLKMKRIGFVSHHSVPVGDVKLFITEEDLSAKEILQRSAKDFARKKNNFLGKCFRDIYNSLFYVALDRRHRKTGKHYIYVNPTFLSNKWQ